MFKKGSSQILTITLSNKKQLLDESKLKKLAKGGEQNIYLNTTVSKLQQERAEGTFSDDAYVSCRVSLTPPHTDSR